MYEEKKMYKGNLLSVFDSVRYGIVFIETNIS